MARLRVPGSRGIRVPNTKRPLGNLGARWMQLSVSGSLAQTPYEVRQARAFAFWGPICAICGRGQHEVTLQVHHITYKRLGHERLMDVRIVCKDCHSEADWRRIIGQPLQPKASGQLTLPLWKKAA